MFGSFRPNKDFEAARRAMATETGYVKYEPALDLVRKYGKQDPLNPAKPFSKELRQAVIEELGLETTEEMDRVRFYSAVGTPADRFHGVDGWIEYDTPDGRRLVVTVDVTKNPNKESWKADVIIPEVTDPSESESEFLSQAEQYAREITERLQSNR